MKNSKFTALLVEIFPKIKQDYELNFEYDEIITILEHIHKALNQYSSMFDQNYPWIEENNKYKEVFVWIIEALFSEVLKKIKNKKVFNTSKNYKGKIFLNKNAKTAKEFKDLLKILEVEEYALYCKRELNRLLLFEKNYLSIENNKIINVENSKRYIKKYQEEIKELDKRLEAFKIINNFIDVLISDDHDAHNNYYSFQKNNYSIKSKNSFLEYPLRLIEKYDKEAYEFIQSKIDFTFLENITLEITEFYPNLPPKY